MTQLGEVALLSEVLAHVGLVEAHDRSGVELPALLCGLGRHAKACGGSVVVIVREEYTSVF